MSTVTNVTRTPTQRASDAVKLAAERLNVDDVKRLSVALNEVAADWVWHNATFAGEVRTLYDAMAPRKVVSSKSGTKRSSRAAPDVELIPLKQVAGVLNPAAPPDPYFLLDLYGRDQLPLALARYTVARLREAVTSVQARNVGTKPKGRSAPELIAYIVTHVTNA
jgi:hypothetical protein